MASVTPANRYALRSDFDAALSSPRMKTLAVKATTLGPNQVVTIAPTAAPTIVPMNRCPETESAAPSDDCVTTKVVIGAQ
jgi:hypothetical protein